MVRGKKEKVYVLADGDWKYLVDQDYNWEDPILQTASLKEAKRLRRDIVSREGGEIIILKLTREEVA